ncbi:DNA-binding PadR family transcriptional regulator [Agromyces hippuratus]|uniref:DNA-binding PadR family transcriptional regulator n=1 Tax=Agromyces hippuratus TaxID=286438 RepID=A0A852WPW7_9MICO|nr:PadR family transcriptional regulator [Agromyces hippuratus]NYG19787.1 DNA-binding PadR family transcriptional regulator [Agromyces hippuratus]
MNGQRPTGGFGGAGFSGERSFGAGSPGAAIWEAMEQLRSTFDPRPGVKRMARGDVRAAVLALLAEQPMHGYQIIQEIEERSGGMWKPSAGSVYPTLQLLADEELIVAEELRGRKTYSLTDLGRAEVEAAADRPAPWESSSSNGTEQHRALSKAAVDLAAATAQLGRSGTPDQVKQAVTVLDDARRALYSILAQS